MYVCMRVSATILLRYMCPPPGQCSGYIYVHDGSCHYSIKMYVPSQDSVWLIYICVVLACHTHLNRIVVETLIHIYMTQTLSWLGTYILIE
jgi:hypothetical protein